MANLGVFGMPVFACKPRGRRDARQMRAGDDTGLLGVLGKGKEARRERLKGGPKLRTVFVENRMARKGQKKE